MSQFAWPYRAVKPNAAERRAEGAGLGGEGADQVTMGVAAMSVFLVIVPFFLENVRQTEWQTHPW